ncbi:hypothetical protein [Microbacterium esteraromaticum]|uniref:hypothetical protein n=1 Tax=Microbacterium esteraromaticum TaxID=57043 RepID=UPI001C987F0C|nr:hypothetical protein [Microbacterium esteraromaticum]MBY6061011.1 hypothetical protein [Microbacterium esteraromaticum]
MIRHLSAAALAGVTLLTLAGCAGATPEQQAVDVVQEFINSDGNSGACESNTIPPEYLTGYDLSAGKVTTAADVTEEDGAWMVPVEHPSRASYLEFTVLDESGLCVMKFG